MQISRIRCIRFVSTFALPYFTQQIFQSRKIRSRRHKSVSGQSTSSVRFSINRVSHITMSLIMSVARTLSKHQNRPDRAISLG